MAVIQCSARTEEDLIELWLYIAQDNPQAAGHCARIALFRGGQIPYFVSHRAAEWYSDCAGDSRRSGFAEFILMALAGSLFYIYWPADGLAY